MTGPGTVVVSILAGGATDIALNANVASAGGDNTVTLQSAGSLGPAAGLSFGFVGVGSTGTQTATLTNTGSVVLTATGVSLAGPDASSFSIGTNGCTGAVAVSGSCNVQVRFTPTATGDRTASLVVTANDPASPHTIPLAGSGAPPATFNVADAVPSPQAEGNVGQTHTVSFAVSLSSTPAAAVSVSYATQYGEAIAGTDYTYKQSTLNFPAGASGAALTQTVTVNFIGDVAPESDETFFVQLYNPTGATTLFRRFGRATIGNDDGKPPTVSVSDASPAPGPKARPPPPTPSSSRCHCPPARPRRWPCPTTPTTEPPPPGSTTWPCRERSASPPAPPRSIRRWR